MPHLSSWHLLGGRTHWHCPSISSWTPKPLRTCLASGKGYLSAYNPAKHPESQGHRRCTPGSKNTRLWWCCHACRVIRALETSGKPPGSQVPHARRGLLVMLHKQGELKRWIRWGSPTCVMFPMWRATWRNKDATRTPSIHGPSLNT